MLISEPDYIVLRAGPGLPESLQPLLGRWYDRGDLPVRRQHGVVPTAFAVVPAGRFEVREHDGAVAEVWEIQA
jgi:hypothetical protein